MNFLKGLWAWYLARKLWQKVVIGIFALGAIFAPFTEETTSEINSPSQSATPTPKVSTSEEASPSVSPTASDLITPVPYSPVQLRTSALGDLADMRKDVADARQRIAEGGFARLYGNVLELSFNLGQLQSVDPSPEIINEWNEKLSKLEAAVDKFSEGISSESVANSRAHLDGILNAISSLEKFVKTVK